MAPRWRAPLLALGVVCGLFAILGGLARVAPGVAAPGTAIAWHGALMASAFLGTVISLERAVALARAWAYLAPLCAAGGGIAIVAGAAGTGFFLLVLAALLFVACSAALMRRQRSVETATLLAGALAWLAGNVALYRLGQPAGWWIAFFTLTIGAERLELSRYLKRSLFSRRAFVALAAAVLAAAAEPTLRLLGCLLVLFAAWLARYDLARVTVRGAGLPRFVAVCLLAGYVWLAVAGAVLLAQGPWDAALHAFFVGFVFSMIFGHAPVILPAVLGVRLSYSSALYVPLALLHASLALRVAFSVPAGAWGNAAAIVLFLAVALGLGLRRA